MGKKLEKAVECDGQYIIVKKKIIIIKKETDDDYEGSFYNISWAERTS